MYVCPARAGIDLSRGSSCRALIRLPRASGDRPAACGDLARSLTSAPRERGSTAAGSPPQTSRQVCPARAGIDPARCRSGCPPRCLPRASGDRPEVGGGFVVLDPSAPRERGSTRQGRSARLRGRVCPARAGIDPRHAPAPGLCLCLPRASGDRPGDGQGLSLRLASAPRERGSTCSSPRRRDVLAVCPARAGIDPARSPTTAPESGLPRASGDRPATYIAACDPDTSAPRERGSTLRRRHPLLRTPVCPARAGIDPPTATTSSSCARLPRASGDRPDPLPFSLLPDRSAPRERGSTRRQRYHQKCGCVCPARAGIDPCPKRAASPR